MADDDTPWLSDEQKNASTSWRSLMKLACALPEQYHARPFHCGWADGNMIVVTCITATGQRLVLCEPWHEFPSEGLIAQLILVL